MTEGHGILFPTMADRVPVLLESYLGLLFLGDVRLPQLTPGFAAVNIKSRVAVLDEHPFVMPDLRVVLILPPWGELSIGSDPGRKTC